MQHLVNLFLKSAFVENMVLAYFLGMCSYLAISRQLKASVGLGLAVTAVLTITVPLNWLIREFLFKEGALAWLHPSLASVDLSFLTFLAFIATIATAVQIVEMIVERFFPPLYYALGIFLPLITVNCAILAGALFMQEREYSFVESVVFGFGAGVGWALAIIVFAAIREKIRYSNVVKPAQGLGIAFILTALMGIAFLGLSGIKL